MILISHRGNTSGPNKDLENNPDQILKVLKMDLDVEIDVWSLDGSWFLGHDTPDFKVDISFLQQEGLWCHAKNLEALKLMLDKKIRCFWHQEDDFTLTSNGYIWTYPGKPTGTKSILVVQERQATIDAKGSMFAGICSDWIYELKKDL